MTDLPPPPVGALTDGEIAQLRAWAQDYGAACAAAEREACARIAATPVAGEQDDITMAAKDRIAAAIRARETP